MFNFSIKIGDSNNIINYAATLTNGEEQLLITRDNKIYRSTGDGGLVPLVIDGANSTDHIHLNKDVLDLITNDKVLKWDIICIRRLYTF